MQNFMNAFIRDEDGAVTVDWVVLTAAIVGLGIAVVTSVGTGASSRHGHHIEEELKTAVATTSSIRPLRPGAGLIGFEDRVRTEPVPPDGTDS